jgi:hypothetical protein
LTGQDEQLACVCEEAEEEFMYSEEIKRELKGGKVIHDFGKETKTNSSGNLCE